ncbi:MAG: VRR-NUC domain-containing protein [Ethanoligenens sp.]
MNLSYARRSEATEQITVVSWCRQAAETVPALRALRLLYHVPNGGKRNKLEAANLKQEGVKAGVPDLVLPVARGAYIGLYIEMKYGDNRESENQIDWLTGLQSEGHFVCVCYSARLALDVIERYIKLATGGRIDTPPGKHGYPVYREK